MANATCNRTSVSLWPLRSKHIHTYLVDVQSLRTSILSALVWISDKYNMRRDYEFVLTRSSVYCMFNLPLSGR